MRRLAARGERLVQFAEGGSREVTEEGTMIGRIRESGQGKLGCIFWALLFVVGVMVAVKMIPVRAHVAELTDYAEEQAKWAGRSQPEAIRNRLYNKARELELPVAKEQEVEPVGKGEAPWMENAEEGDQ